MNFNSKQSDRFWQWSMFFSVFVAMFFAASFFNQVLAQVASVPLPAETTEGLLAQVIEAIKNFGGLSWVLKIACVTSILISTSKISLIRKFTWDKLGGFKVWLAPVLGLVFGLTSLGSSLSWSSALAYVSAGAGAIILHELLDLVKKIPGVGSVWLSLIGILETILGGGKTS